MITNKSITEVKEEFNTDLERGLTSEEAKERLEKYGSNVLKEKKKTPIIVRFLEQFKDFMVIILLIAAVVSVVINPEEWIESLIILIVVLINAILGTYQESKAEKSLDALKKLSTPNAKVLRDGNLISINSHELVPGDVISIEAGDFIPADGRIIESVSLVIDESALTGESVPVTKSVDTIEKEDVSLGDMHNCMFSSTYVSYGRGKAIITGTGMNTEIGKIASSLMESTKELTPLQIKLDQIGKYIGMICIIVCLVVLGMELLASKGFQEAFMTAIALAVASIPEGLATVVTVVLAIGVEKKLLNTALTKGTFYPLIKATAKWFGIKMTKTIFSKAVGTAIPVVGGVIGGGITFVSFKPCCNRLRKALQDTMLSNPNHKSTTEEDEFVANITEEKIIDVDYDEIIPTNANNENDN